MTENEEAPKHQDGKFVFEMIKKISFWEAYEWGKENKK
jgi:hypothetical protein